MREKYSFRNLRDLFVMLSLFLPVNCVLIAGIAAAFVTGSPFDAGVGFVTLPSLMAFIYLADRLSIGEEDRINNPYRVELVTRYKTELVGLAVLSLVLFELSLIALSAGRGVAGVGYVALGHVPIAILYLYDEVKSLALPMDSIAVGFAWSFEITYVFWLHTPDELTTLKAAALFASWFLIVFAGVEARNAADVEGDRETGKVTLAVMVGRRSARVLSIGLKAAGAAILSLVSGSILVLALVALHLQMLHMYRNLENDRRQEDTAMRPLDETGRSRVDGVDNV